MLMSGRGNLMGAVCVDGRVLKDSESFGFQNVAVVAVVTSERRRITIVSSHASFKVPKKP